MSTVTPLRVNYSLRSSKSFFSKGAYNGRPGYELAPVQDSSGWYHVFQNEKPAYDERYLFVDVFRPTYTHPYVDESRWVYLARALTSQEQWTYINERGRPMSSVRYLDARPFSYQHAAVELESGGWCHLDWRLRPIYEERFTCVDELEKQFDQLGKPLLACGAVRGERLYRIFIRGPHVEIVPCIAW